MIKDICSEQLKCQDCKKESKVNLNNQKMIWFKCKQDCNERKDINEILEQNNIDMIDNRTSKEKITVTILPDEKDMPIQFSHINEEIEQEHVSFAQDIDSSLKNLKLSPRFNLKQTSSQISTNDTNTDLFKKYNKLTKPSEQLKNENQTKRNAQDIINQTNGYIPLKLQEIEEELRILELFIDLENEQDSRLFIQLRYDVINIDSKVKVYVSENKTKTIHIKKNCGNLKINATQINFQGLEGSNLLACCKNCFKKFWLKGLTEWFSEKTVYPNF